jgi:hypothetical protein
MALRQILPLTLIDRVMTSPPRNWPNGPAIYFELIDTAFTDPAETLKINLEVSWDGGVTWPYIDEVIWSGGNPPPRNGGAIYTVRLGPFMVGDGQGGQTENRPTTARFRATPIAGTPTVGVRAEVLD